MKILVELIGGCVTGALAGVLLLFFDIDLTSTQIVIIVGGIVGIASIVNGVTTAINKKIDEKKRAK